MQRTPPLSASISIKALPYFLYLIWKPLGLQLRLARDLQDNWCRAAIGVLYLQIHMGTVSLRSRRAQQ